MNYDDAATEILCSLGLRQRPKPTPRVASPLAVPVPPDAPVSISVAIAVTSSDGRVTVGGITARPVAASSLPVGSLAYVQPESARGMLPRPYWDPGPAELWSLRKIGGAR
jgi:hypothetical protein